MNEDNAKLGKALIFLVSQPRAGSTLLQKLIANHPDIATEDEPWLMLPLIKSTERDGHQANYDARLSRIAFEHLMPAIGLDVNDGVRLQAWSIYQHILEQQGTRYFLDKTPRYYEILSELLAIFPQSTIIILFRNPLAVLCSIINTWTEHRWWELSRYRRDLLEAPRLLTAFLSRHDENRLVLRYEDIVQTPTQLATLFEQLDLSKLADYQSYQALGKSRFGDPKIQGHTKVQSKHAEAWQEMLNDPQIWSLALDYLDYLGDDTLKAMGYDIAALRQILDEKRPLFLWRWLSLPLLWLLNEKNVNKRRTLRFQLSRVAHALWRKVSKQ
jgi:sulfotransferase family protein